MTLLFSRASLRWILICVVGLSLVSFSLFGLYTVANNPKEDHVDPFMIKKSRGFADDIPSKEAQIQHVTKALRKAKIEENQFLTVLKNNSTNVLVDGNETSYLKNTVVNFNVHVFYYPWFKSEQVDGKYAHWNHEVIPDWHKQASHQNHPRKRQYVPPGDIGANFYPKLGPYSSHDPKVIDIHMRQMRAMGTGVVCVSWYPPQHEKTSETPVDDLMIPLFDAAAKYGLKVTFHIEPYENRSGKSLLEVSKYIIHKYGNHSAFYRTSFKGKKLPVYYVYDSYQIPANEWSHALQTNGRYSVRNTEYDAIFLGLLVESSHMNHLTQSGFDGFYTYFATNGFSFGSSWLHWPAIAADSKKNKLIFVPSIGPGYLDTRVRPWNRRNIRLRLNGKYYRKAFHNALAERPHFLSITSFNEWHEGTQIEPAVPKTHESFRYEDYSPNSPDFYLNLTQQFVVEYTRNMSQIHLSHGHDDGF